MIQAVLYYHVLGLPLGDALSEVLHDMQHRLVCESRHLPQHLYLVRVLDAAYVLEQVFGKHYVKFRIHRFQHLGDIVLRRYPHAYPAGTYERRYGVFELVHI